MSIISILAIQILLWYSVEAYYCEFALCEDDTYCCGTNICCNNVYSIWYFWAGVVFVLIVLASFCGFFKFCYTPQCILDKLRSSRSPYTKVPSQSSTRNLETQGLDVEAGPPPSYNETMSLNK